MMRHAVDCLHAKVNKLSLLPNRPVVVNPTASKKAVVHHAETEQENEGNKESDECDLHNLKQGCFPLGRM